jgi:hypothetical protein
MRGDSSRTGSSLNERESWERDVKLVFSYENSKSHRAGKEKFWCGAIRM